MGPVMYRLGILSFFCPQEETDDIFSDNICGKWLLPLHESWFEDDGESWVGCLNHKTTHTNPAHTVFFSCFALKNGKQQCFFYTKISLCKSAFVRLLLTHLLDHPESEEFSYNENFVLLLLCFCFELTILSVL
jgi:hypothetical protein